VKTKVKSIAALKKISSSLKKVGKRTVFTNGCFDLVHRGHCEYLKKAKSLGDVLIVGLNSDSSVRRLKGKGRPVNTQKARAAVLAGLNFIDFVTIFEEDTPLAVIKKIKPDILVKGADWDKKKIVGKSVVESDGGKVRTIKYLKGYSTTKILKKLGRC